MRYVGRQGGSIKIFVIVGIILALIALGVLYGVRHYAMNDKTPLMNLPAGQTDSQSDKKQLADEKAAEDKRKAELKKQKEAEKKQAEERAEAEKKAKQEAEKPSSDQAGGQTDSGSQELSGGINTAPDTSHDSDLPQTGSTENMAALALGLITAFSLAYIRSLRHL